jgi:hypothetical protein
MFTSIEGMMGVKLSGQSFIDEEKLQVMTGIGAPIGLNRNAATLQFVFSFAVVPRDEFAYLKPCRTPLF